MISDASLNSLAIFLGSLAMLLIVLYHFLEVNAVDTPDNPLTSSSSASSSKSTGAAAGGGGGAATATTTNKAGGGVGGGGGVEDVVGMGGTTPGKKAKAGGRGVGKS